MQGGILLIGMNVPSEEFYFPLPNAIICARLYSRGGDQSRCSEFASISTLKPALPIF